jgi:hypothetical protein
MNSLTSTCWAALAVAGMIQAPGTVETIPSQPVPGKVHWVFDYAAAKRLALASGKPLFVVFRCER